MLKDESYPRAVRIREMVYQVELTPKFSLTLKAKNEKSALQKALKLYPLKVKK